QFTHTLINESEPQPFRINRSLLAWGSIRRHRGTGYGRWEKADCGGRASRASLELENAALRKEVREVEEERATLRKAAMYSVGDALVSRFHTDHQ
ncbi:hypothetical protein, partial [Streptomyces sp. AV19]|uniref:hypothetical protein n=1 Tax=Streptomyces sp. AV19 TaxID=2793068 RepID=UPI001F25C212